MTVKITKPEINVREQLSELKKPTGVAGEAMLRAETPQEQFNLIGAGRRNMIINGDMRIAQRGTSTTGIAANSSGFHAVDRVKLFNAGGAGPTYTASQESDSPAGFAHSYKIQTTSADTSLPAAHYTILRLGLIEGQDLQGLAWGTSYAKALTLSFWVKSNKTGDQTVLCVTHDSMQQHIKQTFTISHANTWEKKEITFAGNTATAMLDITTMGLCIDIFVAAGSSYRGGTGSQGVWGARTSADKAADTLDIASSTSDYFQITGLQLETGKVATPFEHRSYGEELALCQRYYQIFESTAAFASSTTAVEFAYQWNTEMRAAPSVSATAALMVERHNITNYTQSSASVSATLTTPIGSKFTIANFSGLTSGNGYSYIGNHSSSGHIKLDAEL